MEYKLLKSHDLHLNMSFDVLERSNKIIYFYRVFLVNGGFLIKWLSRKQRGTLRLSTKYSRVD